MKLHVGFQLVQNLVTLNGVMARSLHYYVECIMFYAHGTLAGNSRRKLVRVIRRWKLANVTCFPALVFISRGNLARYSAILYSTLESGVNGAL